MPHALRRLPADWLSRMPLKLLRTLSPGAGRRSAFDLRVAIIRSSPLRRGLLKGAAGSALLAPLTALLDPSGYVRLVRLGRFLLKRGWGSSHEPVASAAARIYADGSLPVDALGMVGLVGAVLAPILYFRRTPAELRPHDDEVSYRREVRAYRHPLSRTDIAVAAIEPSRDCVFGPRAIVNDPRFGADHAERSPGFDRALLDGGRALPFRETRDRKATYLTRRDDESEADQQDRLRLLVRICEDHPRTVDEDKFGLAFPAPGAAERFETYRVGYFDGLLTNDACRFVLGTRDCEAVESDRDRMVSFGRLLPLERSDSDTGLRLAPLSPVDASNHVGVTTLAFTPDLRPVLFQQGLGSLAHPSKIVASGSGSVDYADLRRAGAAGNLRDVIRYAMARELHEEAHLPKDGWAPRLEAPLVRDTRVLGFFRWVERGAKPEFVGVTRVESTNVVPSTVRKRREVVAIEAVMPRIDSAERLAGLEELVRCALDDAGWSGPWSMALSGSMAIARLAQIGRLFLAPETEPDERERCRELIAWLRIPV